MVESQVLGQTSGSGLVSAPRSLTLPIWDVGSVPTRDLSETERQHITAPQTTRCLTHVRLSWP